MGNKLFKLGVKAPNPTGGPIDEFFDGIEKKLDEAGLLDSDEEDEEEDDDEDSDNDENSDDNEDSNDNEDDDDDETLLGSIRDGISDGVAEIGKTFLNLGDDDSDDKPEPKIIDIEGD